MNKLPNQTLALAGILQSSALVNQLATTGQCDENSNQISLESILKTGNQPHQLFPSQQDLSLGTQIFSHLLNKKYTANKLIIIYSLSLIKLEKKLIQNKKLIHKISDEVHTLKTQDFFEITHSNTLARLASLYQNTLGTLTPKIMVSGKPIHLSNERTASHIRALLLAGVRSVSLWRAQGGKTWHLMLYQKKMLNFLNSQ
jgi:high frequency lysogenization protein